MKQYFLSIFIYFILIPNPTVGRPTWEPAFAVSVGNTNNWISPNQPTIPTWAPVISVGLPTCTGLLPVDCKRLHVKYYLVQLLANQEKKTPLIDKILG